MLQPKGKLGRLRRSLSKLSLKAQRPNSVDDIQSTLPLHYVSSCGYEDSNIRADNFYELSDEDPLDLAFPVEFTSTPITPASGSPHYRAFKPQFLRKDSREAITERKTPCKERGKLQDWQRTSIGSLLVRHSSGLTNQSFSQTMAPPFTPETPDLANSCSQGLILDSPLVDCLIEREGNLSDSSGPQVAGCIPATATTPKKLEPIEKVKRDVADLDAGDAIFTVSLDQLISKLLIALNEPNSVYLFRNYAGNFTTFLDRFGPGGYDSHRAPSNIAWVIKLILPWLSLESSPDEATVAIFEEVNGWICNIARYLGTRCAAVLLNDGVWDSCIENMNSESPIVSNVAYETARTIISALPFTKEVVHKVIMLRVASYCYDCTNEFNVQNFHLKLIGRVVERIDYMKNRNNTEEFTVHLVEVINELERWARVECNVRIREKVDEVWTFASRVYRSLDALALGDLASVVHDDLLSSIRRSPLMSLKRGDSASSVALYLESTSELSHEHTSTSRRKRGLRHLARSIRNFFRRQNRIHRDGVSIFETDYDSHRSAQKYLSASRRMAFTTLREHPALEPESGPLINEVYPTSLAATF